MKQLIDFLTSLKLTVICLVCGFVLVFIGTLAQVNVGLYDVQTEYFRQYVLVRPLSDLHASWPSLKYIFPGGYLIGWVLFANLIAAHFKRFKFTWQKSGIFLTHIGIIMLLLGQFVTEVFQVEGSMRIEEGGSKNYSNSHLDNELVLIEKGVEQDSIHSIPEGMVANKSEIPLPGTAFTISVKKYFKNTDPELLYYARVQDEKGAMAPDKLRELVEDKMTAPNGVGQRLTVVKKRATAKMDDRNIPAALVEVRAGGESKGEWLVTNWAADDAMAAFANRVVGNRYANLDAPQSFEHEGKTYEIAMRSVRQYKSYTIELVEFAHDKYQGTEIAKNFSSTVHLVNHETGEERKNILIKMNEPLRYGGETYYQSSFEPGDRVTILQVVRNPADWVPYVSCTIVGVGLLVQFLLSLGRFGKRRRKQDTGGDSPANPKKDNKNSGQGRRRAAKSLAKKPVKEREPAAIPRAAAGESPS